MILEDEFKACSDHFTLMTDDGSYGEKGNVTAALKTLLENGERFDEVIAIGPLIMMKFVCLTDKGIRPEDRCFHESDHGRRHGHVRRLPPDRRRQNEVCLRRRPGL